MRTLKHFLLFRIGPSPWEFWLALVVLVCGVLGSFYWASPAALTAGMVAPVAALFLALDAVRVWHLLSGAGRAVTALFIFLLAVMVWAALDLAADALFPARH